MHQNSANAHFIPLRICKYYLLQKRNVEIIRKGISVFIFAMYQEDGMLNGYSNGLILYHRYAIKRNNKILVAGSR